MRQIDEIKKRHRARKRQIQHSNITRRPPLQDTGDESRDIHPLFQSQMFLIKCMAAVCLILGAGILFKQPEGLFDSTKTYVIHSLEKDLNFTKISAWYENTLGAPVALFPKRETDKANNGEHANASVPNNNESQFAVPVNGRITQKFTRASKGIFVQTAPDSTVNAVKSGQVVKIETNGDSGKTVVVSHNGAESWYGKLAEVEVKPYEFVKKGQKIGTVSNTSNGTHGTFYFALKEGNKFIDPIQVISFD